MIEKIATDLFRLEIPLPKNPLKAINSYLIKTPQRNLLIDTGMNIEACKKAMQSALAEMQVDLNRTDFFITHFHIDHIGLVQEFATPNSVVYFNEPENKIVYSNLNWQIIYDYNLMNGFPESELKKVKSSLPGDVDKYRKHSNIKIVRENDRINIGDYSFNCIETPGHSPGHICLYEQSKKILVSGDHILSDITSNINAWPGAEDSLKKFLASLIKMIPLEVNLMLPGHAGIQRSPNYHRRRIAELQNHHLERAQEILAALNNGGKTAYDIAPQVTWDMRYKSWQEWPVAQKWFATGEVIAHLKYLEGEGGLQSKLENNLLLFYRR